MRAISFVFKAAIFSLICTALYQEIFADGALIKGALYYFTIQSNILAAFSLLLFMLTPIRGRLKCFARGITLLAITLTAIVYNFVLYNIFIDWGTVGYTFSRTVTHVIAPIGFSLDWLLFDKHNVMKWKDVTIWLVYPTVYSIVSLYLGFRYRVSIYFFFNINNGYGTTIKWISILFGVLLLIGFLYVGIDKLRVQSSLFDDRGEHI